MPARSFFNPLIAERGFATGTSVLGKAEPPFTLLDILGNQQGPGPALGQLKTMLLEPGGHPGIFPSLQSGMGPGAGMEMMPGGGVAGITRPVGRMGELGSGALPEAYSRAETFAPGPAGDVSFPLKFSPSDAVYNLPPEQSRAYYLQAREAHKNLRASGTIPQYGFNLDGSGKELGPVARSLRVRTLADAVVSDVRQVMVAAQAGDPTAKTIMEAHSWYRRANQALADTFKTGRVSTKERGTVEAQFSPEEGPLQQHRYAKEFLRHYDNGELDEPLRELRAHLDSGENLQSFPLEKLPRRDNGKLYGKHTRRAMQQMLNIEDSMPRMIRPGQAPKVFRYGGNIGGFSRRPTIDVWAARQMQRLSGLPPIFGPVKVTGKFLARGGTEVVGGAPLGTGKKWEGYVTPEIDSAYGVASDAYEQAAARLGLDPDELQAIGWIREKLLWESKGWTPVDKAPDLGDIIRAEP